MSVDAFPLAWPAGWPRTPDVERVDGRYHFRRNVASRASPFWTRLATVQVGVQQTAVRLMKMAIERARR